MKHSRIKRKMGKIRSAFPVFFKRTRYSKKVEIPLPLVITGACAAVFLLVTMVMDAVTPDRASVTIYPRKENVLMAENEAVLSYSELY